MISTSTTNVYQKISRVSTAFVIGFTSIAAILPFFLTQNATAATANISQIVFTTPEQVVTPGIVSNAITVQTQNSDGTFEAFDTPLSPFTVTSSSGTPEFSTDGQTWSTELHAINFGTTTFYYRDSTPGRPTLTATQTNPINSAQFWTTTQNTTILGVPANGAPHSTYTNASSVAFAWTAATDNADAQTKVSYEFWSASDNNFKNNVYQETTKSPILAPAYSYTDGTTYFWQVRALDERKNPGAWSEVWTFTVDRTAPTATMANDDKNFTDETVTPVVTLGNSEEHLSYSWTADKANVDTFAFNSTEQTPTFEPTVGGTYIFHLTLCDDAGNCSETPFTFTWKHSLPPVTITTTPSIPEVIVPAGLVTTQFNTNNPRTLGVTTTDSPTQASSTDTRVSNSEPVKKQKKITASYADSQSSNLWWWLLVFALVVAAYYAYRNWKLERP